MILGLEEGVRFSPTDKSPLKLVDLDVKFFRLKEFVRQTGEFKVKEIINRCILNALRLIINGVRNP